MERLSLPYPLRYVDVMSRRTYRLLGRGDKSSIPDVVRFARNAIIFTAAAGVMGAATYDYVVHANGGKGLTQLFRWGATSSGDCIKSIFVTSRQVLPGESASMHIYPVVGDEIGEGTTFDVSGRPVVGGTYEFCFKKDELPQAGLIFQAENGGVLGAAELYEFPTP